MDTRLIEYIINIGEEGNITKAAEKLCITQSALNQQLLKLEKELDIQLFERNRTSLMPTKAGEIYINNAKKVLLIKQDTYRMINDEVERKKGSLSIGFTPNRGSVMFSNIYPIFHSKYPDVSVTPNEMTVKMLQQQIASGDIDIGFLTLNKEQRTSDNHIQILSEKMYLIVPPTHRLAERANVGKGMYTEVDIKEVENECFVTIHKKSTLSEIVCSLFDSANINPSILFETSSNATIVSMVRANLCCGIVPYHYIKNVAKDLPCFEIKNAPTWDVVACYRKNSYLSEAGRYFIELVQKYWTE